MKYSAKQIKAAKGANLIELLLSRGVQLKRITSNEYALVEHDSLKISPTRGWYWHSRQEGGNAIDFFMKVEGMSFLEAMETILSGGTGNPELKGDQPAVEADRKKEFRLPIAGKDNDRAIEYLTKIRMLDKELVLKCIRQGKIYESDQTHNCVFVGYDLDGKARYASVRGTAGKRFAGDVSGSDKRFGFFMGNRSSSTLHVFESAIDLLSYMTMEIMQGRKNYDAYLSLSGVTLKALDRHMMLNRHVKTIYCRTDNDPAGEKAYRNILTSYGGDGIAVIPALPCEKDYNDELKKIKKEG